MKDALFVINKPNRSRIFRFKHRNKNHKNSSVKAIQPMKSVISTALLVVATLFTSCSSCSKQEEEGAVATFSETSPYTIEIKKERSYFQAEKIASRLTRMGLGGYVIPEEATDGTWYKVVSGALADSAAVQSYIARLDTCFNIKDVDVVDYCKLDSATRIPVVKDSIQEVHRIAANRPDVPESIWGVISKFPDNDMFYISSIGMLTLNSKGISNSNGRSIDMPRGVSLPFLKSKGCQSIASVIYTDNIYGDNVTLQVVKCKDTTQVMKASLMPSFTDANEAAVLLCGDIADKILATGNYGDETKAPFEAQAYQKLSGFIASFMIDDTKRSYYIFTDEAGEYIYMAQSTKKNNDELLEFIGEIGKSDGLVMYDEFYNSFYTASDETEEGDEFIGYYMNKLTWRYAKSKAYAAWAKKMVGHWETSFVFSNKKYGCWCYNLFDLLSKTKGRHVYNTLYLNDISSDNLRSIYGVRGAAMRGFFGILTEINFGYGRYIVSLNPCSDGYFSERELIKRAEDLQLEKGGYNDSTTSEDANTSQI